MQVTTKCPVCGEWIVAEADCVEKGAVCPKCNQGFVPDKKSVRPWESVASERNRVLEKLLDRASQIAGLSYLLFFVGGVALFIAIGSALAAAGKIGLTSWLVAAGAIQLGVMVNIIAQLLCIRVALEAR